MQTSISPELKQDPGVQVSEEVLRTCWDRYLTAV